MKKDLRHGKITEGETHTKWEGYGERETLGKRLKGAKDRHIRGRDIVKDTQRDTDREGGIASETLRMFHGQRKRWYKTEQR